MGLAFDADGAVFAVVAGLAGDFPGPDVKNSLADRACGGKGFLVGVEQEREFGAGGGEESAVGGVDFF